MFEYVDQQPVELFIDGIGEVETIFHADTQSFIGLDGFNYGTLEEWIEITNSPGMSSILLDISEDEC